MHTRDLYYYYCGGIFINSFIANFLQIVTVKEFCKLVNTW